MSGTATNPDVIDLSNYDIASNIDYSQIKAVGAKAIIVKTSESTNYKDTQAANHIANGLAQGLKVHGYHFYRGNGVAEANWAIQCAKAQGLPNDAYLFIDFEESSIGGDWTSQTLTFANAVKAAGYRAGFYSGESLTSTNLNLTTLKNNDIYLWIANYTARPTITHDAWQFTSGFNLPKYTKKTVDASIDYTGKLVTGDDPQPPSWPVRESRSKIEAGASFGLTDGRVSTRATPNSTERIIAAPDGVHLNQSDIDDLPFKYQVWQDEKGINWLLYMSTDGTLRTRKE